MAVGAGSIARAVKAQEAERKKAEKERKAEAEKGSGVAGIPSAPVRFVMLRPPSTGEPTPHQLAG